MDSVIVEANLSCEVAGTRGTVQSDGDAIDIRFESLADARIARSASGVLKDSQPTLFGPRMLKGIACRIWVREQLVAETGKASGEDGFSFGWGDYWRIRPLGLLKVLLRR